MLKSADLHETILTPVICHKHVRYHDGVTLYFSMKFPSVAPKKTRNGRFPPSEVKTTKNKKEIKKRGKIRLNNLKHWESESRNRSLSAAVLHVKPSRKNGNLYDAKIITKWRFWTTQYPCSTENGTGISSQSISKI